MFWTPIFIFKSQECKVRLERMRLPKIPNTDEKALMFKYWHSNTKAFAKDSNFGIEWVTDY